MTLRAFVRFVLDDRGQDLVEYALLTAFVGVTAVAVLGLVANGLGTSYRAWDAGGQSLWEPPNPQ